MQMFCEVQGNQTGAHNSLGMGRRAQGPGPILRASSQKIQSLPLNGRQRQLTHLLGASSLARACVGGATSSTSPTPTHCQLPGKPHASHLPRVLQEGQQYSLPPGARVHLYTCSSGGPGMLR